MKESKGRGRPILRGFTLTEILVSIAILGILTAILVPVVVSVNKQRDVLTNTSNLRQIGVAAKMWSNDNHGAVVPAFDPGDAWPDSFNNWTGLLAPYLGWESDRRSFNDSSDMPVYVNPTYPERWGYGHNVHGLRYMRRDTNSSIYNEDPVWMGQVPPAETVFFVTSRKSNGDNSFRNGWRSYVRPPGLGNDFVVDYSSHGGVAVVLWLDGHVSTAAEGELDDIKLWETPASPGYND